MNRTFQQILNLTLSHYYYTSGYTSDFVIKPTATTKQILKKHRLLFRTTKHGFFIGCDNRTMVMLPQILSERTLSFTLTLKNKDFMNFTGELPLRAGGKDIYYVRGFQNIVEQEGIEALPLCPPVFTHTFTATGDETILQVQDSGGNILQEKTFDGVVDQQLSTLINLEDYRPGLYSFTVIGGDSKNVYITNKSLGNGIFGLLEITLPVLDAGTFDPVTYEAYQYQYQFEAKSSIWEYHLLFNNDYTETGNYNYTFEINYNPPPEEAGNSFVEQSDPPSDYGVGGHSIFRSTSPVTYQETSKPGIELNINYNDISDPTNNTTTTLNDLPGPSVGNPESKVYLTI